jgi:hypothetical protein
MATKQTVSKPPMGTQVKKQPKFNHDLFEAGVIGALKSAERGIDDNTDNNTCMTAMNEAIELFNLSREYRPIDELGTAVLALQAFQEWLDNDTYVYTPPVYFDATGFTVQITVPNGTPGSSSTFQLHCHQRSDFDLPLAVKAAYDMLNDAVMKNYKPAKGSQPVQQKLQERQVDEAVPFEALRAKMFQNKMVYSLIPSEGKWTQHGAALYPDEARKADINLSEFTEEGDYELAGTMDIEYKPDGKPMRAARISVG